MKVIDLKKEEGQLLVEVLVAIGIGTVLIAGATVAIVGVIRHNFETRTIQTAASLALDQLNKVESFTRSSWHNLADLTEGSSNHYFLVSGATSSTVISGEEGVVYDDVEAGLVGRWGFDEATGTIAYDYSGNEKSGTLTGSPTRTTSSSCEIGACLSFDADTEYVDVVPLTYGNDVTFSVWFKGGGQTESDWNYWIRSASGGNRIEFGTWGDTIVFKDNSASGTPSVSGITGFMDDQWHHAVGLIDDITMEVWIDGILKDSSPYPGGNSHTDIDHYFGSTGSSGGWSGYLDDVRIYNRALSAGEIQQIYQGLAYTKYFYTTAVNKDSCGVGSISTSSLTSCTSLPQSGIATDPSSKKITSVVEWEGGRNLSLERVVTRYANELFYQTDWSGGEGQAGPITTVNNFFASSTNITNGTSLQLTDTNSEGTLYSSTFDSQVTGGATLNALVWSGTKPSGTNVKFQVASSNSASGPGGSATGTIDTVYRYAWNDYIGWIDFGYVAGSVAVQDSKLIGYANNDNIGEISLDCATSPSGDICVTSNYGVSRNDSTGNLSGWALNDVIGWISFDSTTASSSYSYQVNVNPTTGEFSGWAWNDVIGWISFNCFDAGLCGVSDYKVAVAGSSGWKYLGPDGTGLTFYSPTDVGSPITINPRYHNNHRYFRYKVILYPDGGYTLTPTVDGVSVSWSP